MANPAIVRIIRIVLVQLAKHALPIVLEETFKNIEKRTPEKGPRK